MSPEHTHLTNADPILKRIISDYPFDAIESTGNIFHDLMSCVIEQQIHYRSTKKVFQKMMERAELSELTPQNFSLFEELAFEGVKLSAKKYETVLNVVEYWENNTVQWETLSDEEVRLRFREIKGIGPWTIDMILIYTLKRPNSFAFDDFHIKQVMTQLYELNPASRLKAQMKEVAEPWAPHQSTAFLLLLHWKKMNTKRKSK